MDKKRLLEKVNTVEWYHSFEIQPGVFTPGKVRPDVKAIFDQRYQIGDVTGKKILDIGALDGPYSFELERRGAIVSALDIRDPRRSAFNTAKEILRSNVRYIQSSVYDMDKVLSEKFDIILFLGMYYHLKYPLLAFEQIHNLLRDDGIVFIEGECLRNFAPRPGNTKKGKASASLFPSRAERFAKTLGRSDIPLTLFYAGDYSDCPTNWFIPNVACIREWLTAAGLHLYRHGFVDRKPPQQRFWGCAKRVKHSAVLAENVIVDALNRST